MCRAGTVFMTSAGCNHARQSGWQDDAVTKSLSGLITRCSSHTSRQTFCGKLTIDSAGSGSSPKRSRRGGQLPPSLASLVLSPDDEAVAGVNTLDGKCKFCTLYESEIRMAEQIKRTLMDYNMALLLDETRFLVEEEMERAFQHAVDDAVKAYGIEGKGREKALRTLDSGYQKASAEISRICGEKQLAPYRELYGSYL